MNNKTSGILIGAIVLISAILMVAAAASAANTYYYVSVTGNDTIGTGTTDNPWRTIQYAVDNTTVSAGDTIIVRDGTYNENVNVDKRLTIKSENGSANCFVNASASTDHVFDVTVDWVNISGFTVTNATGITPDQPSGIFLYGVDHCNISDNNVSDNYLGIKLSLSNNNSISNNAVSNNTRGIYLYASSTNNLTNNTANSNTHGIYLWGGLG